MAEEELTPSQASAMLNKHSGLYGLSGLSPDMRELEIEAGRGDARADLAIEVFAYRVQKYLGAYAAALGGVDAVAFTGGIGENSAEVRRRCTRELGFLGITLDPERNRAPSDGERRIDDGTGHVQVWVIPTDEEIMIARAVLALGGGR
jgi:acetate kinase